ncbi:MAG: 16S rRNA (cytosine(1402)-N(4))-methyltransferase RsmH [Magnetospirillum sp. WYHS-4]
MAPQPHVPVLLQEVLDALAPRDQGIYVDATFGAGGYSRALLRAAGRCTVWGIDRDPDAVARGQEMAKEFPGRFAVLQGRYGDMRELLGAAGVNRVDGVAMDLGVSSMQIDEAERGFSFRTDGPLDMRMERDGPSAADLVNELPEVELADIIYRFGEERASRRIAQAIAEARRSTPFARTAQLAELVRRCVRKSGDGIDPATRTFQALRIAVNDELGEIDRGLAAAESLLAPGGRLAVVSFHSLEDRKVKEFLRLRSGDTPRPSRHLPQAASSPAPSFRLLTRGAVKPSAAEASANPRARSARLRAAERTEAPAWEGRHAA